MRGSQLTMLAAGSVVLLVVLLAGYFTRMGPGCQWYTAGKGTTATLHWGAMLVEFGRCRISIDSFVVQVGNPLPTHFHLANTFAVGLPEARRSLWEFDAHRLGNGAFILACPIWCVAMLCTIAPALWLRQRHQRRQQQDKQHGFAVELSRGS